MKTLYLSLKKEWYEIIERGEKKEEYREIKPYWEKRLIDYKAMKEDIQLIAFKRYVLNEWTDPTKEYPRGFTHVRFSYGYTRRTMTFEVGSITIGKGRPEWGAPEEDVFIIKLGKKIMKTIEERAKEYSEDFVNRTPYDVFGDKAYICASEINVSGEVENAFITGAKSEHEELTRWNSPECEPKVNTPILLKMEGPRKDIIYRTGYFIVDYVANDRTVYFYKVIGWREIHE